MDQVRPLRARVVVVSSMPGKSSIKICCPGADTVMLTEAALKEKPCTALDMGTGSGYSAIELARRGFKVHACDICPHAVGSAKENALQESLSILFFMSDLWEHAGTYDMVIFNPPLSRANASLKGIFRRFPLSERLGPLHYHVSGGFRREIVKRFISGAKKHLQPGGRLLIVTMTPELHCTWALAREHGFELTIVASKGQYSIARLACN